MESADLLARAQAFRASNVRDIPGAYALWQEITGQRSDCVDCQYYTYLRDIDNWIYSNTYTPNPMSDNKLRFKRSYEGVNVTVEGENGTRLITAKNFTDADAELLRANGRGHIIEEIPTAPKAEAEGAVSLSGLNKAELQALYKQEVSQGDDADPELTKAQLTDAIETARAKQ